jgi:hypothetical protein
MPSKAVFGDNRGRPVSDHGAAEISILRENLRKQADDVDAPRQRDRENACDALSKAGHETPLDPASERNVEHKTRKCLICRAPFPSAWAGERICRRCKSTEAWRRGSLK